MIDDMNDDDTVEPNDPQFDAWIETVAPSLNAPPVTPRLEMWDAIAAAQPTALPGVLRFRRARWIVPTAIAAALLIGIGIDRFAVQPKSVAQLARPRGGVVIPSEVEGPAPDITPSAAAVIPSEVEGPAPAVPRNNVDRSTNSTSRDSTTRTDPAHLYRLAAIQTLSQAEALLTAYRASDIAKTNVPAARQLGLWGREVLSSTRLLIDSPAGDDPQLRSLLNDLELVLVQIIRLSGAPLDSSERALIDKALRDRDLLPRIRTAVPAGVVGAASDD